MKEKTYLVTGSAGFIGFYVVKSLIESGINVVGVDNLNDYYERSLKQDRLKELDKIFQKRSNPVNYQFLEMDLANRTKVENLFQSFQFDKVLHLAAQAGVRYSIENPHAYVDSNLVAFVNILEGCRTSKVAHLVYASSSSVYGMNTKIPFSTEDRVDFPISLYAATKKSNELMAHTYSHLYSIPTTGLRFFTVYGPWGRPDMAYFSFTDKILQGKEINVFNHGKMQRDFTYIDDIVSGVVQVTEKIPPTIYSESSSAEAPYRIFNIGNNNPIELDRFIKAIENATGNKAVRNNMSMQAGDVPMTYADVDDLQNVTGFKPSTSIEDGIGRFVTWYREYYHK